MVAAIKLEYLAALHWNPHPTLRLNDIKIAPAPSAPAGVLSADRMTAMSPPRLLQPGERIEDNNRLRLMQKYIDGGHRPKTAARLAAEADPSKWSSPDATVKRLTRRYKKLLTRS
jgi:hypothetical protein